MPLCKQCSWYFEDYDIENLPRDQQIRLEKLLQNPPLDLKKIETEELRLLSGVKRHGCIGGLIRNFRMPEKCRYYDPGLPPGLSREQLLQLFNARRNSMAATRSWITTLVIAGVTLITTLLSIYLNVRNNMLQIEIEQLQRRINQDSLLIKSLMNHSKPEKNHTIQIHE